MSPTKKIEDLVYSGKVMDDYGNWIPIAEQLQKEKRFLLHLERGEILLDGTWIKMSDLVKHPSTQLEMASHKTDSPTVDEETTMAPLAPPEETVSFSTEAVLDTPPKHPKAKYDSEILIRAPEETVSFSTDTIRDFSIETSVEEAEGIPEFPPETKSLFIEPADSSDEKGTSDKSDETLFNVESDYNVTEFEETVLYNIKMLKDAPISRKTSDPSPPPKSTAANRKPAPKALRSIPSKQTIPGSLLVFIAIIVVIVIVLLRLFL
jgi:hypothetical protein